MSLDTHDLDCAARATLATRAEAVTSNVSSLGMLSFFLLTVVFVTIGWRILFATLNLAWNDDRYTHILLIAPITVSLIYLDPRALGKPTRANLTFGLTLLVLSVVVASFLWWHPASLERDLRLSIGMLALLMW